MTASRPTDPDQTVAERTTTGRTTILAWEELDDELARYAWQPALRFALDFDHAAQRCRRRVCKLSGRCHLTTRDGEPLDCGGGVVSDETLIRASGHVLFGCAMLRRFCADFDIAPALLVPEDDEPARPRRSVSRRRKRS